MTYIFTSQEIGGKKEVKSYIFPEMCLGNKGAFEKTGTYTV